MDQSEFAERIAKVRARFAARLPDKLLETDAALLHMAGDGSDAVDAVAAAYRRFHEMCGIAATVGFEVIGQAARTLVAILVLPFRERRGLSADELASLTGSLASLRIAARTDMQSPDSNRELAS